MLSKQFLVGILPLLICCSAQADELTALPPSQRAMPVRMLQNYLRPQVHQALDERLAALQARTTPQQIKQWQRELRAKFVKSLGGFPKRTPLGAQVVGRLDGPGCRIEKIIYESRPRFFVTALLYLPKAQPPYPAVLLPCGHSENGKAAESYQRASIQLARGGLAVLCYDPIGQGERKQILQTDDAGRPLPRGKFRATSEHTISGVAAILLGENLATYRIWDGIRGIDYLASRKDIDASRIGCTGNSGGGMMTSYLMALDERIGAAAPGCFITTTRRKNERPGPGDAEQNIFGQTAHGLDHPDFLMLAAPRPALICAATHDFVPIKGIWEAFRQTKQLYTRLGAPERVDLVEADERHGFTRPLRIAATRWMRRWLLRCDDALGEDDFPIHSDQQLQCTSDGQVLLMNEARSLFDLYGEKANMLAEKRRRWWKNATTGERIEKIRQMAAIRRANQLSKATARHVGPIQRDGYRIEKLLLYPEERIVLPALLFEPADWAGEATLYVHGEGKHAHAMSGGPIEQLVRSGQQVLAVDLRGYGETETTPWRFNEKHAGANAAEFFIAYMLGRSLVGMRAEDILSSARYLSQRAKAPAKVHLVAIGRAAASAVHAAATAPEQFASLELNHALDTWLRVIETQVTIDQLENTVHGALRFYDLPDLIELYHGASGKSPVAGS